MNRAFTNVLSDDVDATAQFYEDILGMVRHADYGWFVILTHPGIPGLEFGILDRTHETVPGGVRPIAGGTIVTFVVDDLENALRAARRVDAEIIDGDFSGLL